MTILEGIRSIIVGTKIPKYLWEEITKVVNYIQNWRPTKAIKLKTPKEIYIGIKPNLSHLRILGCIANCHIPDIKQTKLEPKAVITILVGYDESSKVYHCYNPATRKIIISHNVHFNKHSCDPNIIQITKPFTDAIFYSSSATHSQNKKVSSLEIQSLSNFLLLDSSELTLFHKH